MIDFHNHILPGVDDGSKSMAQSIEMLRCAESQGITDIVNTVHFQHPQMEDKDTSLSFITSVRDSLLNEMSKNNIKINIHLGAEVFFNFNFNEIITNPLTTFLNGKYMLIEFQTFIFPIGYEKHLYELKISGITPIIAHPERYKAIQENPKILQKLILGGALIQIDAGSLLGHFGKKCYKTAINILSGNMCHIIGSDAHNDRNRNICLYEACRVAKKIVGDDYLKLVNDNPYNIIHGNPIDPPEFFDLKDSLISKISNIFFK